MQTQVNEFLLHKADAGFHYWHGHTSLDRTDGLQGGIIIDDPDNPDYTELKTLYDEERVIVMQDWFHRPGPSSRIGLDSVPFIWIGTPQSFLINGLARFADCKNVTNATGTTCSGNCTVEDYSSSIDVEAGKTYLLHIVNAGALLAVNFAITNHSLQVVMTDGTVVEPFQLNTLDIGVGQRYSVLLTANQDASRSYWIETTTRFRTGPSGVAYLRYGTNGPPSDSDPFPSHPAQDDVANWFIQDNMTVTKTPSLHPTSISLRSTPDLSYFLVSNQLYSSTTGQIRWAVNNVTQRFSASPTQLSAYQATTAVGAAPWPQTTVESFINVPVTPPLPWNYSASLQSQNISTNNTAEGTTVLRFVKGQLIEIVMQNALSLSGAAEYHGWHMHGHQFWVVGQGTSAFNPDTDPASYNLVNPVLRDTLTLLPYGWTTIWFVADNPGSWPYHCTITPHLVMGMGTTVVTSPELAGPPPEGAGSCLLTSLDSAENPFCPSGDNNTTTSGSVMMNALHAAVLMVTIMVVA